MCFRAGVCWWMALSPSASGCRVLGVPKLVSAHQCVGLDPGAAGSEAQGVPELVLACW